MAVGCSGPDERVVAKPPRGYEHCGKTAQRNWALMICTAVKLEVLAIILVVK